MYPKIVVPLDGSDLAEQALPYAEALARLGPSTLYLVRAAAPDDETMAADYLARTAAQLRADNLVTEVLTAHGRPSDIVAWKAAHVGADLVVMATHGRGGPSRWVLGSVADEVLHRTTRPVLLVREGQRPHPQRPLRVLVPLDGSELAEQALTHARAIAGPEGEIVLFQAVTPATVVVEDMAQDPFWSELLTDSQDEALRYLEQVAADLRAAGYPVRVAAEHGFPAARIAQYAREQHVDLIVLGSHGRSGAARWLLGSVADELVRLAPVPLLLLRPLAAVAPRGEDTVRRLMVPLDATSLPPRATLDLDGKQVRLVGLALECLKRDLAGEPPLVAEVDAVLAQFAADRQRPIGASARSVAAPVGGGAVAAAEALTPAPTFSPMPGPEANGASHAHAVAMTTPHGMILRGYPVFAHRMGPNHRPELGQFVGTVEEGILYDGVHYLHVRGGIEGCNGLYLPLGSVQTVVAKQVHLNLSLEDLAGRTWHLPPAPALQAV
jgi:nucleotide-binding universal stress UspA family protein